MNIYRYKIVYNLLLIIAMLWSMPAVASLPIEQDDYSAVILAYHKIEEPLYPDLSLSEERFAQQILELTENDQYQLASLKSIVDAFQNNTPLKNNTIAISFDGPYRSSYEKAFPFLIKHQIPFTIFVSPQLIESDRPNTINWDELSALLNRHDFIDIGVLPYRFDKLISQSDEVIQQNITQSLTILENKIDQFARSEAIYSYPFGEYTTNYRDVVKELSLRGAVTLSSGVAHSNIDLYQIPRFAMTDSYGTIERFRTIINAAPLPVSNWTPQPFFKHLDNINIKQISFSVTDNIKSLDLLRCFVSGQNTPHIYINEDKNDVTLSLDEPLSSGRTRINCTMPGPHVDNILNVPRYRWHGMLYSLD